MFVVQRITASNYGVQMMAVVSGHTLATRTKRTLSAFPLQCATRVNGSPAGVRIILCTHTSSTQRNQSSRLRSTNLLKGTTRVACLYPRCVGCGANGSSWLRIASASSRSSRWIDQCILFFVNAIIANLLPLKHRKNPYILKRLQ